MIAKAFSRCGEARQFLGGVRHVRSLGSKFNKLAHSKDCSAPAISQNRHIYSWKDSQLILWSLAFAVLRGSKSSKHLARSMPSPFGNHNNVPSVQPWKYMLERVIALLPSQVLIGLNGPSAARKIRARSFLAFVAQRRPLLATYTLQSAFK